MLADSRASSAAAAVPPKSAQDNTIKPPSSPPLYITQPPSPYHSQPQICLSQARGATAKALSLSRLSPQIFSSPSNVWNGRFFPSWMSGSLPGDCLHLDDWRTDREKIKPAGGSLKSSSFEIRGWIYFQTGNFQSNLQLLKSPFLTFEKNN